MSHSQKSSPTVTLAIIHWNNRNNLEKLLRGLGDNLEDYEVVVVNNSPDVSLHALRKNFRSVKWIVNTYNRGFSFACNQATSMATREWIFYLNPDVHVTKQHIDELLSHATKKKLVAVSPKPKSENYWKPLPSFFSIVHEFTSLGKLIPKWLFLEKTLTGGALLIQTEVIKDIGGWDERFFLWFEDSDLTQRLSNKRFPYGWTNISITHQGGQSVKLLHKKEQLRIFFHSLRVYAKKYFSFFSQTLINRISHHYDSHRLLPQLNSNISSIIIPNLSTELLFSFLKNNYAVISQNKTELIVVTTQLPSTQFWQIKREYPETRVINLDENQGFAQTTNIGFNVATGAVIGTMNDDIIIDDKNLEKLLSKKNEGSLNPKILNPGNHIESVGITILKMGKAKPITKKTENKCFETDTTNAACVLYNATALEKVGIYDERFGSYLEDIDLSIRLKKAGYKNVVDPALSVLHLKHQTSQSFSLMKAWNDLKNWWLLMFKHPAYFGMRHNFLSIFVERMRNFWGFIKAVTTHPRSLLKPVTILGILLLFLWLRFYNIQNSLLFFNDIGRDFLTLLRWEQTGKPPLLGPQTSALPYNQSALYFYVLYPLFVLTQHSPFSTLYTNAIFYVSFFIIGLFATRRNKVLQSSLIFSAVLIAVHPQFIYQQRFVWNPSFVAPFIISGTFLYIYLVRKFSFSTLIFLSLSFALASAFSYSAAPTLIAVFILLLVLFPKKIISIFFTFGFSLTFVNLPTVFFELRHHFLLTKLLLYGEKLPQVQTSLYAKTLDTFRFSLLQSTEVNIAIFLFITGITLFVIVQRNKDTFLTPLSLTSILFVLNFAILAIAPISIQAHYVFPFLTLLILIISFLPMRVKATITLFVVLFFLQSNYLQQYFARAYRSVDETNNCAAYICSQEKEPFFVSVQSDLHPYHNGMEFKYLFAENGCNIKELDTQISEASTMAVVVDHSQYEHGKTSYNELTQFGESAQTRTYTCQDNLKVVMLEKMFND